MKFNSKKLPQSVIELEVVLDEREFNDYWERAYQNTISKVQVKGFRPGSAPKELAEDGVDKEKVFETALDEAVRYSLNSISLENNWTIIDKPKIEVTHANPFNSKDNKSQSTGLKYKAQIVVFPEIELANYKKIAPKVFKDKKPAQAEPEEIEKTLTWLRNSRAKVTRANKGLKLGDLVEVDIKSLVEGKPIAGGELKGDRFVLGESRFIPGFDEELLNHREGETLKFSIKAREDYWQKNLRGKTIDFEVRILGVFDRELPDLNSDFIKGLGPNFSNLEDLKDSIRKGITHEKEAKEQERLRAKMLEAIVKDSKIDPPQIMVDRTLENLVSEVKLMTQNSVQSEYVDEELRKQLAPKARERVLANLVLHKLAQAEHLEPTEKEVEEESRRHNLDPKKNYDYSYGIVQHRKVFEFLERQ